MQRFGLYGGAFDPVHLGHLLVARAAIEELRLDRLFFIPAFQSPFKPENKCAPAELRLQWLRLALAGKTNCEVDDREIRRGGASYTIETARAYTKKFPGAKLFYLIGADNVPTLKKWRDAGELSGLLEFAAVPRPGQEPVQFPKPFLGATLKGFPFAISSSGIRERIKNGLPIDLLVPGPVTEAIRAAQVYL